MPNRKRVRVKKLPPLKPDRLSVLAMRRANGGSATVFMMFALFYGSCKRNLASFT
jgi:hypothetical protein